MSLIPKCFEAKLTEDDGTARDQVARIQPLHLLSIANQPGGNRKFDVVACLAGRGFGVRRADMKKLLFATQGKVFTPKTLDHLVGFTALRQFKTKRGIVGSQPVRAVRVAHDLHPRFEGAEDGRILCLRN